MKLRSRTRVSGIFELQPLEIRRFLTTASLSGGVLTVTGTSSAETITVNKNSSNRITISGWATTYAISSVTSIIINAGAGSDTITITGAVGSGIPSTINAGDGNDQIATGLGDDVIFGQNGFDTVNYSARVNRVTVSLDGAKNDGETQNGETDNVNAEEVIGGAGNDVFYGNDSSNYFAGGAGNDEMAAAGGSDELLGNTGNDRLYGEGGDDALFAKNNDVDTVNGGTGPGATDLDLAETDSLDVASSVSSSSSSLALRNAALAAAAAVSSAALDPTYGPDESGLNSGPDFDWTQVTAATVDSLGRTILVGYAGSGYGNDFVAVRYDEDGLFDETFAGDGQAEIDFAGGDDLAFGVTTDADDNIIIVGQSDGDLAVSRLDATGALDTDFGARTYVPVPGYTANAADVVVDDAGRIVIAGTVTPGEGDSDIVVLRLLGDGSLDFGFNNGDGFNVLAAPGDQQASAVIMDELLGGIDEGILVGGTSDGDFFIARITLGLDQDGVDVEGELDGAFGDNAGYSLFSFGEATVDQLNDLMVNPVTGQIVAVGQTSPEIIITFASPVPQSGALGAILSVDADGSSNANYQTYGVPGQDVSFNAIAYDPWNSGFAIAGATGSAFIDDAFVDGDFIVAKFDNAQTFAPGFEDGLLTTDFSATESSWPDVALGLGLRDGKIIVGGYSDKTSEGDVQTSVARYNVGTGAKDVEDALSYEDVQDDKGANRSALATFYLKSTHLDDEGNATITLTNNDDLVTISMLTVNGQPQARVEIGPLVLYYDMDTTSITINCLNGDDVVTATDDVTVPLIILGGNGTDSLTGGGGGDVLVGGQGNDTTVGNSGNDIQIGGAGADMQSGGAGEDIFVGGTTAYDANLTALKALQAEWNSASSNADRIKHIRGTLSGGVNGTFFLKLGSGATVFDDSSKDSYTGGNDRDWFFRRNSGGNGSRDVVLDNLLGEELSDF